MTLTELIDLLRQARQGSSDGSLPVVVINEANGCTHTITGVLYEPHEDAEAGLTGTIWLQATED